MIFQRNPTAPVHVRGMNKGEELVLHKGREQGRGSGGRSYRSARDSTSIEPDRREPIDPAMPNIPPP